ncbi:MAG: GIY-YIG nuclease family protein [Dehalococcoidia bacterium]|nr:GIY-YIG nuclease family protein [Dehalococcoidia bacterium]
MAHFVYILRSERTGRYYTGYSADPQRRLEDHNRGQVKATRYGIPWSLVYTESFGEAREARQREYKLKSMKSRAFLESLIQREG